MAEKVDITSTSRHSAICSDIVIREGTDRVRLVFRPEIVDNPTTPRACVRGRFLYQRKGKAANWEDFDNIPLSSIKKGEGYELSLKSLELLKLMVALGPLYRHYDREGIPQGRVELLRVERSLSELLSLTETELLSFLSAHSQDAVRTLKLVLQWFSKQAVAQELTDQGAELPALNALVGLANLRSILKIWEANADNRDEEFWQKLFGKHSFVLSQLFSYPVVLIRGKAYVGGKDLSNTGGNVVDFLFRTESSGAAVLIEIKTPQADLLGGLYRDDVYPTSRELSGAISQVLEYRESLSAEMQSLVRKGECLSGADPQCVVIVGHARQLDSDGKKRSFERFRERLLGVRVVTFDEVFERIRGLIVLLERS